MELHNVLEVTMTEHVHCFKQILALGKIVAIHYKILLECHGVSKRFLYIYIHTHIYIYIHTYILYIYIYKIIMFLFHLWSLVEMIEQLTSVAVSVVRILWHRLGSLLELQGSSLARKAAQAVLQMMANHRKNNPFHGWIQPGWWFWILRPHSIPIGSMVLLYMVTFTINIPPLC